MRSCDSKCLFTALGLALAGSIVLGIPASSEASPARPSSPARKPAPSPARRKLALVNEALRQRGKPYVWGGASRGGFDCSGLTRYVFQKRRGVTLPHSASAQSHTGQAVNGKQLTPGDCFSSAPIAAGSHTLASTSVARSSYTRPTRVVGCGSTSSRATTVDG